MMLVIFRIVLANGHNTERTHSRSISRNIVFAVDTGQEGHHKSATERLHHGAALRVKTSAHCVTVGKWGNVPSGKGGGL